MKIFGTENEEAEFYLNILPEARGYIRQLLTKYPVQILLAPNRKRLLGCFKVGRWVKPHIIIMKGQPQLMFTITLLHELAHYLVYLNKGKKEPPHGPRWKATYSKLLSDGVSYGIFDDKSLQLINQLIANPKATVRPGSAEHVLLYGDKQPLKSGTQYLSSLNTGSAFELNGNIFILGFKLRTRYTATHFNSGTLYFINEQVAVKPIVLPNSDTNRFVDCRSLKPTNKIKYADKPFTIAEITPKGLLMFSGRIKGALSFAKPFLARLA